MEWGGGAQEYPLWGVRYTLLWGWGRSHTYLLSPTPLQGLALQQQTREEGGALGTPPGSGPHSFLAQQRLATAARRARPPHGRPPNR